MSTRKRRNYRSAVICGGIFGIAASTAYLQWHYHRAISPAVFTWAGLCVLGVGLSLRAK